MKIILLVLKKEMRDIIRNRRRLAIMILFNFVLLPTLTIAPMFLVMRRTVNNVVKPLVIPVQGIEYAPGLVKFIHENAKMDLAPAADVKQMVLDKKSSVGLIIPPGFEAKIMNGESVSVVVVEDKSRSLNLYAERLRGVLNDYNEFLRAERLAQKQIPAEYLNPVTVGEFNAATASETTGSYLGLLIPGFIITFGLTSGLSVAISSIAGEKDKQTLEPVLFTAISRAHLVIGKLLAVLVNVFLSALGFMFTIVFYGIAVVFALVFIFRNTDMTALAANAQPVMTPAAGAAPAFIGYAVDPLAIMLFLFSIVPIILIGAALQIMISSIARNSEEAFTYALPLSIFSLAPIFASFFLDEFTPALGHYAIPVFGTILSMRDLLSGHVFPVTLLIMFGSSALYAVLAIAVAVWMFNREEVLLRA